MEGEDIRWKHRFQNFENAYFQFKNSVDEFGDSKESLIKEGIIQWFEFTHELAWKVMKDFLSYKVIQDIVGSRSATREAFNKNLITDGIEWMNMLETRNLTVHTYQDSILDREFENIKTKYYPLFEEFYNKMKTFL